MVRLPWLASVLLGGCVASSDDSTEPELPPEDTFIPSDSTTDTFFVDTSFQDTGFDGNPDHLLTITWLAHWDMSPGGGPYTTMTGTLSITEVLDGNDLKPTCLLEYSLTGQEADENCPGCSATFDVNHYLVTGDAETCKDPDRPEDGALWTLGWSGANELVYYDYQDSGVWVEWYAAERVADSVDLTWETTVGVAVDTDTDT